MTRSNNAERQARWRQRHKERIAELEAKVAKLEAENARLREAGANAPAAAGADQAHEELASAPKKWRDWAEARDRRREREYQRRVKEAAQAEVKWLVNELILPAWDRKWDDLRNKLDRRKGHITGASYKKILSCLHTDSRNSASDERLNEAFRTFKELEKVLVDETDSPTHMGPPLPRTYEELMEAKRRVSEARKAQRAKRDDQTVT
jgi:hypothetical protein